MRSVYDGVLVKAAVRPCNLSGTGTPGAKTVEIDTQGYNSALFNVAVGTSTGTSVAVTFTLDAQLWESDTSGSGYVSVSGATITQITSFNKSAQIRVEGLGTSRKRYLYLILTPAVTPATDALLPVSATCCLGRAFQKSVGNSSVAA